MTELEQYYCFILYKKTRPVGEEPPHGIVLRRDRMTPVEKTPRTLAHAHKGQTELGPATTVTYRPAQRTVTWAGDAAAQASEHSEGVFLGANTRVRTLAGGHNQRPPHQWASLSLPVSLYQ